jgi:hypothetical protein
MAPARSSKRFKAVAKIVTFEFSGGLYSCEGGVVVAILPGREDDELCILNGKC